jgi:xanthine dehydrogenase small subunit
MSEPAAVRFVLDGAVVEATDVQPTTTVLEFLRERLGRTGTKEGCAEGDCGACTVVLGELSADGERIGYRAVNSCIRFIGTIDGQELVTCESLSDEGAPLHPVQRAMVDRHASQCGFCTPGFVMSLFALYLNNASPAREEVIATLAGNLCRCTGYRPIIDAGCTMNEYPAPNRWSRDDAQSSERRQRLKDLRRRAALAWPGFIAPRTLDELADRLAKRPDSLILAGATDIGLWVTKQLRELPPIVYVGEVAELKRIEDGGAGGLRIGAAVTLTDAWQAILKHYPQLTEVVLRFASPPVCNSGTLCGNIANGSPIGDSMPALMALGARVELRLGSATRTVPLDEFYLGYQRKDMKPGEFVVAVSVPAANPQQRVASYKVSKRFDQDISSVCTGFVVELDGAVVRHARLAYGGMAAVPARAPVAEKALLGKPWSKASVEAAAAALAQDFKPLTDVRASDAYRLEVAGNLLRRFYLEGGGTTVRLDDARVASA